MYSLEIPRQRSDVSRRIRQQDKNGEIEVVADEPDHTYSRLGDFLPVVREDDGRADEIPPR